MSGLSFMLMTEVGLANDLSQRVNRFYLNKLLFLKDILSQNSDLRLYSSISEYNSKTIQFP